MIITYNGLDCKLDGLTPREREALMWAAVGYPSCEIAERMGIKARAIYAYRKNIFKKLYVSNCAQAVALLIGLGEIAPEEYVEACDSFAKEWLENYLK